MSQSIIGQGIFYVGMIVGIISSAKLPEESASWPDTMMYFGAAVVVCIVGLVVWRTAPKNLAEGGGIHEHPLQLLEQLKQECSELIMVRGAPMEEIQSRIETLLQSYFVPITTQQPLLYQEYGMERAAHILITLSYAQRMLHRSQSAYADGHTEESLSSLQEALEGIMELKEKD